jgi:hypothetical protein
MKAALMKRLSALLLIMLLLFSLPSALAQDAVCESGGFSLTLPDSFQPVGPQPSDDPELCFNWRGGNINVQGFAVPMGKKVKLKDLYQILTDDVTDYGTLTINRQDMLYARGRDDYGTYYQYSWLNNGTRIDLYFYYEGKDALLTIDDIIHSLVLSK